VTLWFVSVCFMCLAGWDALQSYGGMVVRDKLILKVDQVLARCGWAVEVTITEDLVDKILVRYPHCNEAQLLYIAGKSARRLASDIQTAYKRAAKWLSKDMRNQKRKSEWKTQRADAMSRMHELMGKLSMPPHERFALMTYEKGGDAELLRIYPKSTRNQRDQWRSRARKLILAYDPSLEPWVRLRREPDFSTPRKPSMSIELMQSTTSLRREQ
jgi:hypothetical protein